MVHLAHYCLIVWIFLKWFVDTLSIFVHFMPLLVALFACLCSELISILHLKLRHYLSCPLVAKFNLCAVLCCLMQTCFCMLQLLFNNHLITSLASI